MFHMVSLSFLHQPTGDQMCVLPRTPRVWVGLPFICALLLPAAQAGGQFSVSHSPSCPLPVSPHMWILCAPLCPSEVTSPAPVKQGDCCPGADSSQGSSSGCSLGGIPPWRWMGTGAGWFRSGKNVGPRTVLEEGELHLLASWGLHLPEDAEQC